MYKLINTWLSIAYHGGFDWGEINPAKPGSYMQTRQQQILDLMNKLAPLIYIGIAKQ